ncbi:MAG: hypothetical protein C0619_06910 [Desulfuromonas sp.]|nr:MAG: hypothetical protein C0619_06910 [Desulfuromonas sp.]
MSDMKIITVVKPGRRDIITRRFTKAIHMRKAETLLLEWTATVDRDILIQYIRFLSQIFHRNEKRALA